MTARAINTLLCDKDGCSEQVQAHDKETAAELRVRAEAEHGWRCRLGHDLCRWHG